MSIEDHAAGIGALADPTRRALYEYVIGRPDPSGREAAAEAAGVADHIARFHLDKLVDLGLLEVEFRRLSGRSGPGAGRPAKLYRRAADTIAVSLPPRRFDLAGHILARAIEDADGTAPLYDAVRDVAREEGRIAGAAASEADPGTAQDEHRLRQALRAMGYEPRTEGDELVLANCPFDALARTHTALVCGMNQAFVEGMIDGARCTGLDARLAPHEGRCCVTVTASAAPVR
ncbi:helix-turn-helix transcriptional regulator [Microbacterium resistens]|uniref:helix-turn-helix transcriptional regulator n=1 Tax=Microbacterium resistens TaxID=156977 RepID=UPI000A9E0A70|nr:helix-turn-helix domain-containing protein [Microbacterium resistens]